MIKINILSGVQKNPFGAQWDKKRFPESLFYICENSDEKIEWDIIVIYENIRSSITFQCRKGQLIYVAGEPPMMRPLPNSFLKQFDEVIIPNTKSKHSNKLLSHGFLNWSLGVSFKTKQHRYNFEQLKNLKTPKTKNISIVTSTKRMMPGHNRRMYIIEQLKKDFPGQIDYYGQGHQFVDFKADVLIPYKFHICMENSAIPYYWTEKFSDPLLANCIPIYLGCTNLEIYFDKRGYIPFTFDNYAHLKNTITTILQKPEALYEQYLPFMRANRDILLNKENLIPFIIERYSKNDGEVIEYTVNNLERFRAYRNMLKIIRLRRLIYKIYYSFILKFRK
ncbi:glycosyltransferase family 10 domain-containing protein [Bacteroides sp. 519]|uniref:glycosyltransferase family 10 domain-containing protein n=1 Tax=Bacteroides sp. 519 TaxID=2302937 RepID=UPI0013D090E3|nr:glycosyltransferase family 10 [Bacteroides sp. 519]NDV57787.1 hypothetical protein [Bacteroides sp. 519]